MSRKNIKKILFNNFDKEKNEQNGVVFFEDNTYIIVQRNELIKHLELYAKQNNIKKIDNLLNDENIVNLNSKENAKKIIKKTINELTNNNQIETEKENEKSNNKLKRANITFTALGLSLITALSLNGIRLIKKTMVPKNVKASTSKNFNVKRKYENMTFKEILDATQEKTQKSEMQKIGKMLDGYNGIFANKHIEQGNNVRAALKWDEVISLNLAYNKYNSNDINLIFNGINMDGEILDSTMLSKSYKSAYLQLMSAYVLEDNESKINLDNLINSEEGKEFYKKYNEKFLKCKTTTGEEQKQNIEEFYQMIRADFPINKDSIEVGMAHSEDLEKLKPYMLSVTPIIGASEILFQNISDKTLTEEEIKYFNDAGLCNFADEKFKQYESMSLVAIENEDNPYYQEFKVAKLDELNILGYYHIDDASRDLSKLEKFKTIISNMNGISNYNEYIESYSITSSSSTGSYSKKSNSSKSTTKTENKTTTKTTNDRNEAVSIVGEDAVKEAEDKVNKEIENSNQQNKSEGERRAEENRKQIQDKEDNNRKTQESQAAAENNDTLKKIDEANDKINSGGTVNEADFGKTTTGENVVNIYDEYKDNNGNIDSSVKDITTDPSGVSIEPMPTPKDSKAEKNISTTMTNEEIAENIINEIAKETSEIDSEKIYYIK